MFNIFMANLDKLSIAVQKNVISEEEKALIIEYKERLCLNSVPVIFNLRHFRKLLKIRKKDQNLFFSDERSKNYRKFFILKKNGKKRTIEAPTEQLKLIQSWIKEHILEKVNISKFAMGFRKNYNIVENAQFHVNKELVINIDLKDFFPSITYGQVMRIFSYLGYNYQVSHLLTKLCTNSNNVLPQGSPASPILSNIVALKLDKRLSKLAEKFNASYTRYADDITFSGSKSIKKIFEIAEVVIKSEGFEVNGEKVRLQYHNQRQEVTGLIVNDKITVHPRIEKEINNAIYYCKKFGVSDHMKKIGCNKSFYKEHLYGLAYFIKMVDMENGEKLIGELNQVLWGY